jgi:transaldolase
MELYLDSANPEEILEVRAWGLISGVTTNPSLMSKRGSDMKRALTAVLDASPGPVFCQAVGWQDPAPLVAQARWLHQFSERIIVKLPMSHAGIQALLASKRERPQSPVCITAVGSVAQAYLAGKAGADVVALFDGPLDQASDSPVDLVAPLKAVYRNYGFPTKVLSVGRYPRFFGEIAVAGVDICTVKLDYMRLLFEHPFTEQRINGFLKDWRKTFGDLTWTDASR